MICPGTILTGASVITGDDTPVPVAILLTAVGPEIDVAEERFGH